jgi:hypothetical protein
VWLSRPIVIEPVASKSPEGLWLWDGRGEAGAVRTGDAEPAGIAEALHAATRDAVNAPARTISAKR